MSIDFNHLSLDSENGLLLVLGKVLEKVQIMLNKDAFRVKENQHAFSHGRSTVSALVNITHGLTIPTLFRQHNRGNKAIHSLFIDSSKAFDLVDHSIVLSKLKERKINKSLWQWLQNLLQDRTQQVKCPGVLSTTRSRTRICSIVQYLHR